VETTRFDDDPVQVYLREACAVPALTKDEEIELSQHVLGNDQQAEAAGNRLVEANLAVVVSIAERYSDRGIHVLELVQAGNDGLLLALKTFAENSTESFSAHAAACINASIEKAIAGSRPACE
jgi:DNA-directed RNA polymerase sigma subunit (sigma70/sigma32)